MSKIRVGLRVKDLYAIKHALQGNLQYKNYLKTLLGDRCPEQIKKDIEHESKLVEKINYEIKSLGGRRCVKDEIANALSVQSKYLGW